MSDFINEKMPVANPDPNGLYPWMAIRAGGNSVLGNLRVTRPINMGNRFFYNVAGEISGAYHKYNNTIPSQISPTGGEIIQNPANAVVEATTTPPSTECVVDKDLLTITNNTALPQIVNMYARIVFTGYTPGVPINPLVPVDGDTILIGITLNGVPPVLAPGNPVQQVVVYGQNGPATTVEVQLLNFTLPGNNNVQIAYQNLTNPLRGILVKDVQLIVQYNLV